MLGMGGGTRERGRPRARWLDDIKAVTNCTLTELCILCGANIFGDGGVHTLSDNSAFVNPGGQLLLPGGVRPGWIPSA